MTITTTKPTVVFVPGGWHLPSHYKLMTDHIVAKGYKLVAIRTPGVRQTSPYPTDFTMDTGAVVSALLTELDEGNEVFVVMHSYGGVPGSAAVQGLTKEDRQKEGLKGGVIGLVYLTSFALEEGFTNADLIKATYNLPGNIRRQPIKSENNVSTSPCVR